MPIGEKYVEDEVIENDIENKASLMEQIKWWDDLGYELVSHTLKWRNGPTITWHCVFRLGK